MEATCFLALTGIRHRTLLTTLLGGPVAVVGLGERAVTAKIRRMTPEGVVGVVVQADQEVER